MLNCDNYPSNVLCFLFGCLLWTSSLRVHAVCSGVPLAIFSDVNSSYRENLGLFLNEIACRSRKEKLRVVEVGVFYGAFSQIILQRYNNVISEYVMIEPHEKITGAPRPELMTRVYKLRKSYPNIKITFLNEFSVPAAQSFPDGYFDWIYIDALHTYRGVADDIRVFWPKLAVNGLFSGHDFVSGTVAARRDKYVSLAPWAGKRDGREKRGFPGTYKAAVQHARKHALPIFHTLEGRHGEEMWSLSSTDGIFRNNPSWFMFKYDGAGALSPYKKYVWIDGIFQFEL
mmetsp:Transcript_67430/g.213435  ORF Transcript_67430/g.213435 Transcript_67430/m.213435 type:complete len:286 (-) Transcript_67430:411-1268(-)